MKLLILYDIPDDRVRVKVADACLDYGLQRVQLSAFFGDLSRSQREEIGLRIKRLLGRKRGYIIVLPVCDRDINEMIEIGLPMVQLPYADHPAALDS